MEAQVKELAEAHPRLWSEIRHRQSVVDRYLDIPDPCGRDIEEAARKIGKTRRTFYRLLEERRRAATDPIKIDIPQRGNRGDAVAISILDEVIAELGRSALREHIFEETRRRCESIGVPAPSRSAVRTRLRSLRTEAPGLDANSAVPDLILDHSALELNLITRCGRQRVAFLSALLQPRTGMIIGHHLRPCLPDATSAAQALLHALERRERHLLNEGARIAINRTEDDAWGELQSLLESTGLHVEGVRSSSLNHGMAIGRILSGNLGRIPLAPRWRVDEPMDQRRAGEPVRLSLAEEVVSTIVRTWNDRLAGRRKLSKASSSNAIRLKERLQEFIEKQQGPSESGLAGPSGPA